MGLPVYDFGEEGWIFVEARLHKRICTVFSNVMRISLNRSSSGGDSKPRRGRFVSFSPQDPARVIAGDYLRRGGVARQPS